jgi:signal transduction histidine kinase
LEQRVSQRTAQVLDQQRELTAYEERQRLARELHDSISQSLFSINLSARALRGLVRDDPEQAVSGMSELEHTAQAALAEMRALLAQLRAPQARILPDVKVASAHAMEDKYDLVAGLARYCEQLKLELGPDGRPPLLDIDLDAPRGLLLPEQLFHQVTQIAREGIHNVSKHAGVRSAVCELHHEGGRLTLVIRDRGCGFDPGAPTAGYGLQGMRERVEALGGEMVVVSRPGAGANLQVSIPLDEVEG